MTRKKKERQKRKKYFDERGVGRFDGVGNGLCVSGERLEAIEREERGDGDPLR